MIVISMIVTFLLIFLAGMHYATFDICKGEEGASKSIWWSIGLALIGIYSMINVVGLAVKAG